MPTTVGVELSALNAKTEYTSTEKLIGKWHGKNLYRQSIAIDGPITIAGAAWHAIKTIAPNLNIVSMYGGWSGISNDFYAFGYGNYYIYYNGVTGSINFNNPDNNAYTVMRFSVIIDYTKS